MKYLRKEEALEKLNEGGQIKATATKDSAAIPLGVEVQVKTTMSYNMGDRPIHHRTFKAVLDAVKLVEVARERISELVVETTYELDQLDMADEFLELGQFLSGFKTMHDMKNFVINLRPVRTGFMMFFSTFGRDLGVARAVTARLELKKCQNQIANLVFSSFSEEAILDEEFMVLEENQVELLVAVFEKLGHKKTFSPLEQITHLWIKVADYAELIVQLKKLKDTIEA